jgi:hypothetical protein
MWLEQPVLEFFGASALIDVDPHERHCLPFDSLS